MKDPIVANPLRVTYLPVTSLKANPENARTHSRQQIQLIAKSITNFGFNNPILIHRDNIIIAGHGRVEAAKVLGIAEVPTIQVEHLSQDQLRAYVLADNRLPREPDGISPSSRLSSSIWSAWTRILTLL